VLIADLLLVDTEMQAVISLYSCIWFSDQFSNASKNFLKKLHNHVCNNLTHM